MLQAINGCTKAYKESGYRQADASITGKFTIGMETLALDLADIYSMKEKRAIQRQALSWEESLWNHSFTSLPEPNTCRKM